MSSVLKSNTKDGYRAVSFECDRSSVKMFKRVVKGCGVP